MSEKEINDYVLNQTVEQLELIGQLIKSCQDLVREAGTESPFCKIFQELWPFIVDTLQEMGHLDTISESATRLVKHSIRIIPDEFKNYII